MRQERTISYPQGGSTHLGGVIAGEQPSNPHVPSGPEGEEHRRLTTYAGNMGQISEGNVLKILAGRLDFAKSLDEVFAERENVPTLKESWKRIIDLVHPLAQRTHSHNEILSLYEEIGKPSDDKTGWDIRRKPLNPDLGKIIRTVDAIYGSNMEERYDETVGSYGLVKEEFRYYFETLLILAREAQRKAWFIEHDKWGLYPDVNLVSSEGKFLRQIDAVAVSRRIYEPQKELDFWALLENKEPWMEIEIKTLFQASRVTGKNKLRQPVAWHLNQSLGKIGKLAVEWAKRSRKNFTFPTYIEMIYLRGPQEAVVHQLAFTSRFLKSWLGGIDINLSNGNLFNGNGEKEETALLRDIVARAAKRYERREKSLAYQARIKRNISRLASNNLKQKKLGLK